MRGVYRRRKRCPCAAKVGFVLAGSVVCLSLCGRLPCAAAPPGNENGALLAQRLREIAWGC